jgi:hypothetical protein
VANRIDRALTARQHLLRVSGGRRELGKEASTMGQIAMVKSTSTKESQTLVFSGATVDDVADKAALYFAAQGYRLESGTKTQGVYARGSQAAHMVIGALAGLTKFNVTIGKDGDAVAVVLARGMSGAWGGLLGMSKMRKAFQELITGLQGAILS